MAITPSDEKRVDGWDERHIVAYMFTKGQSGTLDDYWVLDSSGNCWYRLQFVSHGTINRECQMVGQALKMAYPKIVSRPIIIRKLTENAPRRDFFEPQEVQKIIDYLPEYLQDYVRFAWYSGWRRGEISSLTFDDIRKDEIHLKPENSKNGEARLLPLTGDLLSLIRKRQSERVEECPYVFHRNGKFIGDFRKAWYSATKKAGCRGKSISCLEKIVCT